MSESNCARENRYLSFSLVLDAVLVFVAFMPIVVYEYVIVDPFRGGFFCSDETIRYPLRPETISGGTVISILILLSLALMIIVELTIYHRRSNTQKKIPLFGYKVPLWLPEISKHFLYFLFGFAVTYDLSEICKFGVGRLRPNFMAACQPQLLDGSTCDSPQNQFRYVENYICTAEGFTTESDSRVRASFPSAHSSLSFYAMVYMCIYLQHKVTWRSSKLFLHLLQSIFIAFSLYMSLSRFTDNWHHWSDIVSGVLLGVVLAVLTAFYITKDFSTPQYGSRPELERRYTSSTSSGKTRAPSPNVFRSGEDDTVISVHRGSNSNNIYNMNNINNEHFSSKT